MKVYREIWGKIEEIEADKIEEKSVWIKGRRRNRISDWESFFKTWDEAKAFMVDRLENELAAAKQELDKARSNLEAAKALKP